jgi:DNA-binding XRE family transcriptional regulator
MPVESISLAHAVTERREALGLGRKMLARMAGLSPKTIFNIEEGEVLAPSPKTWLSLQRVLGWAPGALAQMQLGEAPTEAVPLAVLQQKTATIMWPSNTEEVQESLIAEYLQFVKEQVESMPHNSDSESGGFMSHIPSDVMGVVQNGAIIDHLVGKHAKKSDSNLTIVTLLVKIDPNAPLENNDIELVTRFTHIKDRIREAEHEVNSGSR